jgi:hypothetical protein
MTTRQGGLALLDDEEELVFGTPPDAPKMKALRDGDRVAVTIDTDEMP